LLIVGLHIVGSHIVGSHIVGSLIVGLLSGVSHFRQQKQDSIPTLNPFPFNKWAKQ
jgi:hypothetical protein